MSRAEPGADQAFYISMRARRAPPPNRYAIWTLPQGEGGALRDLFTIGFSKLMIFVR